MLALSRVASRQPVSIPGTLKGTGAPLLKKLAGSLRAKQMYRGVMPAFKLPRPREAVPDAPDRIKVFVNGNEVSMPKGGTVLQGCEAAGIQIPRFCYHDRLSVAGNCRMCLVEVEKTPKPVASCAMPAMPGMKIHTETDMVKKAREGVMEFLLVNHPLDCPICDQGGECDLQDQSMAFGSDRTRSREWRRAVEDKNLGPLVKTVMTRCIHCTRCVRFSSEIAGVGDLGVTGRGNGMEIGTYVEKVFDSELSGNVIDLCPVGALTSKPYAFTARPWELTPIESVDPIDSALPLIRVDTRGTEIMRILPRLHEDVNEEWISDKTRFSYDGLKRQRLDSPMKRVGDEFVPITWEEALVAVGEKMASVQSEEMMAIAGDLCDAESMIALKDLFNRFNSDNLQLNEELNVSGDLRSNYLLNSTIAGIEAADVVVLVGTNPRMESPLIAARIRKSVTQHGQKVYLVGPQANLAFKHHHVGDSPRILSELAEGKHGLSSLLSKAKRPLIIVGQSVLKRQDASAIVSTLQKLRKAVPSLSSESWNGISYLPHATSQITGLELGFQPKAPKKTTDAKFVYLLAADEFDIEKRIPKDAFVVYQGHHGDAGASRADIILPGAAYTEKNGLYMSLEGRVQRANQAVPVINKARDDWKIIRALSDLVGKPLPYDSEDEVRARLAEVSPAFATIDTVEQTSFVEPFIAESKGQIEDKPLAPLLENFFMTNPISRSSRVMARSSQTLKTSRNSYITPGNTTADKEAAKIAAAERAEAKGKAKTNYL